MSAKPKKSCPASALQLLGSVVLLSDRTGVKHVINVTRSVSSMVELFSAHCDVYYRNQRYK